MDAPQCTSNNLVDIINWLKEGDVVTLHTEHKKIKFHNCTLFPNKVKRTIYVNVSSMPALMDESEWPYYILGTNGNKYCDCKELVCID